MQRALIVLLFNSFFSNAFAQESIEKFSFKSSGRGFRESILIRKDSTFVSRQSHEDKLNKQFLTTEKNWNRLIYSISQYSLHDLENLPAPTNARAFDGAMFSDILITTNKNEYNCGEFDSYNPNEKLKGLLKIMLENEK